MLENLIIHHCTQHIAMKHHFIKRKVQEGEIEVCHVFSSKQLVYIIIKPLTHTIFENLGIELGLVMTTNILKNQIPSYVR